MEHYSSMRKKEILQFVFAGGMDLEGIMLSLAGQTEKDRYIVSYKCGT